VCDLTITDSAHDAILCLKEHVFDYIFLDHDLGQNSGCGADVVAYLCDNIDNEDNSWNTPAVNFIKNSLKNAMFFPFGSKEFLK